MTDFTGMLGLLHIQFCELSVFIRNQSLRQKHIAGASKFGTAA